MRYLNLFIKSFDTDNTIQLENYSLHARKEDGYINVGKLCAMCGKKFAHWLENKQSKEFLFELELLFKERGITAPLYSKTRSENKHGTYAHPIVAINVAQWASTKFEVRIISWIYEMFLNGEVNIQSDKTFNNLENIRIQQLEIEQKELRDNLIKKEKA